MACETLVTTGQAVIAGEVKSQAYVDLQDIARRVINRIGYTKSEYMFDGNSCGIFSAIHEQSADINRGVEREQPMDQGAGDQGIMFGYATAETESRLPFGFDLANKIIAAIENDIETNPNCPFVGDAKTQVTVDLDAEPTFASVQTIVVSVCHKYMANLDTVRAAVTTLIQNIFGENPLPELIINPSGTWTLGGPTADCGLTGRKIVCDQYGGYCAVGGGAFSGKDPTKVDRSASYMARHLACKLLDIYKLSWCEVQLGYAIGIAEPVSLVIKNDKNIPLEEYVLENYDLTPLGIIEKLNLIDRDYERLAEGCHYREALI